MAEPTMPDPPAAGAEDQGDVRIGVDEWVSQVEERRLRRSGRLGQLINRWETTPPNLRAGFIVLLLVLMPLVTGLSPVLAALGITNNLAIVRVGTMFLAFAVLAIGLNVVVGYAGLLDLGFNAFFGIAGYAYAYLSSDFISGGVHVPSIISIPLIVAFTAGFGWVLGSSSLRLRGDYLAIVTLGFGLLFFQLTSTLTRVQLPWLDEPVDLTRGPNGINLLDNVSIFGYTFNTNMEYYYLFLVMLIVVYLLVGRIRNSRVGRAWRAMREDELAAEVMGMPTRNLKLLAFAIGAAIAALSGTVFAAWQGNVVPIRYNVLLLINLYAMIVLGGLASLPGAVIGAFIFTVLPDLLRNPELAGFLFYTVGIGSLVIWLRPWRRLAAVLGGTIAAGLLLKVLVMLIAPSLDAGTAPAQGSLLNQLVQLWLVIPANFTLVGNAVIALSLILALLLFVVKDPWRMVLLGVTIYALAFAWETRLATEASVTRILIIGVTLVVLMIRRPQGLLGKLRVTIV